MNRTVQIILGIIALILVAGGSFYGGMLYGEQKATASLPDFLREGGLPGGDTGQPGAFGMRGQAGAMPGGGAFAGMTVGQIESVDGNNLMITDNAGKQIKVTVTDTTLIEKQASVTVGDLEIGETIMISGSENEDGSITARSVQSAPAGRLGGTRPEGMTTNP